MFIFFRLDTGSIIGSIDTTDPYMANDCRKRFARQDKLDVDMVSSVCQHRGMDEATLQARIRLECNNYPHS